MTDEVATAAPADETLAKAIANGYVEPVPPSREDRVKMLISDVEHAMANNAPIAPAMLAEMKALLG